MPPDPSRRTVARVVQQAWHGRWRDVHGVGVGEDGMDAWVARAVARDGYASFRVGAAGTDGEEGAPMRPVHAVLPLPPAEGAELLRLCLRACGVGTGLRGADRERLRHLRHATRGEVIGATDDRVEAERMVAEHDARTAGAADPGGTAP